MTPVDTGPDIKPVDNDEDLEIKFVEEPTYNPMELTAFMSTRIHKSWIGLNLMIRILRNS